LGIDLLKAGPDGVQEAFAYFGRRHAARGAGQQVEAEPRFEFAGLVP
jgi:hypothetical protein